MFPASPTGGSGLIMPKGKKPAPGSSSLPTRAEVRTSWTLKEYRKKRDFEKTPEPPPAAMSRQPRGAPADVRRPEARRARLHYDFRLEVDGVLKSWPLPKGPSLRPEGQAPGRDDRGPPARLRHVRGRDPEGRVRRRPGHRLGRRHLLPGRGRQYSWDDREEAEERMREGSERGKLSVFLQGTKLKGSFALVKQRRARSSTGS